MNWEDSLQDSKGVNAETDSDGIPEYDEASDSLVIHPSTRITHTDKQDANVGSLLDQLTMHNEELRELSQEIGRKLTVLEAHTYRIRKLKDQLITRMLEEEENEL